MPVSATRRLMTGGCGSPKIDIKDPVFYAPLWSPDMVAGCGDITSGTGTMAISPVILAVGANTITATGAGTFIVRMPEGGTVASGTATITGSPVTIPAGIATSVTTGVTTGNFTCTVSNIIRSKDKNIHACTVSGALWTTQGRQFDAVDDYISIGNTATIQIGGATTVVCWIKDGTFTGNYRQLIWKRYDDGDGTQGWQVFLHDSSNTIYVIRWYNNVGITAGGAYNVSQWMQFVYVYDGAFIRTYLNGDVLGTPAADVTTNKTNTDLLISAAWGSAGCTIGEAIIYNRALSQSEIRSLYSGTVWRYK